MCAFSKRLGISLGCDSNDFVCLSVSPHHLYDANAARQSRPDVVFIIYLLAQSLRPLTNQPRWIGMPVRLHGIIPNLQIAMPSAN